VASVALLYTAGGSTVLADDVRRVLASALGTTFPFPFSGLVGPGGTVVIKPNMVRHFNPVGPLAAMVTSPVVVLALVELAFEAVGANGTVVVADSPQNDCDFAALVSTPEWAEVLRYARSRYGDAFQVVDMRPEGVLMRNGIVVDRRPLPGDPKGEVEVDLGDRSAFRDSGIDSRRLRGSDYDPAVTTSSHSGGRHVYSICRTFLDADLLIVVPKVKTHKKVGLSLAMKNLVGLVGEKNCLPHHTAGFAGSGGDEYPTRSAWTLVRQWGVERARPLLAQRRGVRLLRGLRRLEKATMPEVVARSGNWWGNDTAWRMVVDLVAVLHEQRHMAGRPTVFVYDGLVVGEGDGPLAPEAVDLGLLAAADDPVAGDIAVSGELGVDVGSMPLLREALAREVWGNGSCHAVVEHVAGIRPSLGIRMHPGWMDAPHVTSHR
jgi:uncharacterized protein (DUF362 family)